MKLLYIIFVLSFFLTIRYLSNNKEYFNEEACSHEITDEEYLRHMIPHHQVAVDMSKKLLENTKNDFMIHLAYRIIQAQQNEIILLNDLLDKKNYKHNSNLLI